MRSARCQSNTPEGPRRSQSRVGRLIVLAALIAVTAVPLAAVAAIYNQPGTCSGTYSNWRGDYTTGYAYFGKSYSSDMDCKRSFVDLYNAGAWKAGAADPTHIFSAQTSHLGPVTHSAHLLCWNPPNLQCHTQHWLNF